MGPVTLRIVLTVIVIVLGLIFAWVRSWYRFVKMASKIPGPSLFSLLKSLPVITDFTLDYFNEKCHFYDFKAFQITVWRNIIVLLSNPDDIAVIMKSKHLTDKPRYYYKEFEFYTGENLVSMNGSNWKRHRHAFNPGFHHQILQTYIPLFHAEAQRFVKTLRPFCTGKSFDISGILIENQLITLARASVWKDFLETAGVNTTVDVKSIMDEVASVTQLTHVDLADISHNITGLVEEITNIIHVSSINPLRFYLYHRFKNETYRVHQDVDAWKDCFRKLVSTRKKEVEDMLNGGNENFTPISSLEHSIVKKKEGKFTLSDSELTNEIFVLILAGTETSAFTSSVILALLALHPQVQEKVSEELHSIFEGDDREATMDDLKRMEYLDCVIKETLRLFPSIPVTLREAKDDVNINGTIVPKGALVGQCIWSLHRNPKYFKDPLEFHPERFCQGNWESLPQYAYIPFSAGPRACIGSRYATMQIKTFLSTVLRSYEVQPGEGLNTIDDIKVVLRFTLRLTSDIPLCLYPRSWGK